MAIVGINQTSIFEHMYPSYRITKPIRLIELFAGVGSQAMALRDLGANFKQYRVVEIDPFAIKSYNAIHGTNFEPTQTRDNPNQGRIYASEGISPSLNCMEGGNRQPMIIPENTVKGYAEAYPGDGVYINRPHQIRKLTPLECWRLMGFSDEDFRKAEAVNSNTQLYSQAGNSIVKQVLMAIFKKLIAGRSNKAR